MARTILDEGDLLAIAAAVGARLLLVEDGAEGLDHVEVGLFVPAADIVGLAQLPGFEDPADGAAMVLDVEPVADLLAVAVDRHRLAGQGVVDHQWDELFREVVGAVVVRAVGGQHRQPVGVVIGPHQVVGGRLGRRVGTVRLVAVVLGEGRIARCQRAIDFVGGDVEEAECRLRFRLQRAPVGAHFFQQAEGADDVGLDEVLGAVDRAVHMGFRGEVEDRPRLVLGEQAGYQLAIADIAGDEGVPGVAVEAGEVLPVAGVGELVEADHRLVMQGQPVEHEIGADEAGAAGHENRHESYLVQAVVVRRAASTRPAKVYQSIVKTTISTGKMAILPTPDLVGASDPAFYAKCHHRAAGRRIKQKSPARGGAFRGFVAHQESKSSITVHIY